MVQPSGSNAFPSQFSSSADRTTAPLPEKWTGDWAHLHRQPLLLQEMPQASPSASVQLAKKSFRGMPQCSLRHV